MVWPMLLVTRSRGVYWNPDLTGPVRACGAQGFTDGRRYSENVLDIGFSEPCADIWLYNILNTRRECLASCLGILTFLTILTTVV